FFLSSIRRHTRSKRDWSSDVCSSDLASSASSLKRWRRSFRPISVHRAPRGDTPPPPQRFSAGAVRVTETVCRAAAEISPYLGNFDRMSVVLGKDVKSCTTSNIYKEML